VQNEISVYVDIIFLENLIIDYVIVDICGRVSGFSVKAWRVFLSAAFGAGYAVFICVFTYFASNLFLSGIMKIVVAAIMCGIAFGFANRRRFVLCNVLLYAVSVIFAGVFLALKFSGAPIDVSDNGIAVSWGESSSMYVFGTVLIGYIVAVFVLKFIKKRRVKPEIHEITVEIDGKCGNVMALCDTGNELRDKLRDLPVIICETSFIGYLFDDETVACIQEISKNADTERIFDLMKLFETIGLAERVSLVPCKTVSDDCCMLLGLAVDSVFRVNDSSCRKKATVCFVDRKLSDFGEYNAVASPEIFI